MTKLQSIIKKAKRASINRDTTDETEWQTSSSSSSPSPPNELDTKDESHCTTGQKWTVGELAKPIKNLMKIVNSHDHHRPQAANEETAVASTTPPKPNREPPPPKPKLQGQEFFSLNDQSGPVSWKMPVTARTKAFRKLRRRYRKRVKIMDTIPEELEP